MVFYWIKWSPLTDGTATWETATTSIARVTAQHHADHHADPRRHLHGQGHRRARPGERRLRGRRSCCRRSPSRCTSSIEAEQPDWLGDLGTHWHRHVAAADAAAADRARAGAARRVPRRPRAGAQPVADPRSMSTASPTRSISASSATSRWSPWSRATARFLGRTMSTWVPLASASARIGAGASGSMATWVPLASAKPLAMDRSDQWDAHIEMRVSQDGVAFDDWMPLKSTLIAGRAFEWRLVGSIYDLADHGAHDAGRGATSRCRRARSARRRRGARRHRPSHRHLCARLPRDAERAAHRAAEPRAGRQHRARSRATPITSRSSTATRPARPRPAVPSTTSSKATGAIHEPVRLRHHRPVCRRRRDAGRHAEQLARCDPLVASRRRRGRATPCRACCGSTTSAARPTGWSTSTSGRASGDVLLWAYDTTTGAFTFGNPAQLASAILLAQAAADAERALERHRQRRRCQGVARHHDGGRHAALRRLHRRGRRDRRRHHADARRQADR